MIESRWTRRTNFARIWRVLQKAKEETGKIRIQDRQRGRYRCRTCGQTFSARRETMLEGLRKPAELIIFTS